MSTPTPPPDPPRTGRLPYMTGYEHFILSVKPRVKLNHPRMDSPAVIVKCAELWQGLMPCEKTYWNKVASDYWDRYTRSIMQFLPAEHPQNTSPYAKMRAGVNLKHCKGHSAHYLTTQDFMVQSAMAHRAKAESAMAQGATAKGATTQGATAEGATAQVATDQGVTDQGVTAQGATAQGATAQGATTKGATPQRAMAQGYRSHGTASHGYMGQGVMPPGYWVPGATAQGFWVQAPPATDFGIPRSPESWHPGIRVHNQRAPDEMAATSGVTQSGRRVVLRPMVYPSNKIDMESGTSYKSYLYYGDDPKPEVRRFFLTDVESYLFEPLQAQVCAIYKLKQQKFTIAWKDEDGDEVLMSSDAEVKTMLTEGQEGVIKLVVRCEYYDSDQTFPAGTEVPVSSATNQGVLPAAVHVGVICDGCDKTVVGHRYKCISCDNFDLCAKCETEGKHSHHCVVRVPHPNMPVPLLKSTIKRSHRFLKSVISNAVEEKKNLRRERKHTSEPKTQERKNSSEPKTQGKQDSQPRTSISWMEIFNKYMEDFANIAGTVAYGPEKETRTTEAATSTEARSGEAAMNVPTGDQIDLNPWGLDVIDLSRLQRACKYMRENKNLGETTKQAIKIFGALDSCHGFAPEVDWKKVASNLNQGEKDIAEAGPSPRQEVMKPESKPEPQESAKIYQGVAQPELATQAAGSAKMAQITTTREAGPQSKDIDGKQGDNSELVNAMNKCEVSSNASSEGNGSEKADGWTIIDAILSKKESADSPNVEVAPMEGQGPKQAPGATLFRPLNGGENSGQSAMAEALKEGQEPVHQQAPLYPQLNVATAIYNTKASGSAATAPAAPPASTAAKQTEKAGKKAVADTSEHLRAQLAPHVEAALQQMEAMGFSNESGWLSQLLNHHDGNIAIVLDLITPITRNDAPNSPNAGR